MGGYNKMTKEQVRKWMYTGRELEFESGGKQYSLSPFAGEDGKMWISFCEFYQDTLDVPDVDALWDSSYQGKKVSEILEPIPEDQIDGR